MTIKESQRKLIINLINKGKITTKFTKERPTDWNPGSVDDPEGEFFHNFTDISAWRKIIELLEKGHPLEEVILKNSPGAKGYVMKVDLVGITPQLYIKLEVINGNPVLGRSFHYSERS